MFLEGPDFISYLQVSFFSFFLFFPTRSHFSNLQDESGQLFESSEDGTTYSLLLRDVVLSNERVTGYTNLESLLGNFVANVKVTSEYSAGVNWKTLISHEMGSEWFPLPVPEVGIVGGLWLFPFQLTFFFFFFWESRELVALRPHKIALLTSMEWRFVLFFSSVKQISLLSFLFLTISLFTHIPQSGYPILAQEQTSGVIVANGHEGDFLVEPPKASRTQVFLSRDSGFTFEKIADRSHYFGLGDHGGVLVMVETEETQDLKFSENQGFFHFYQKNIYYYY